MRVPLYDPNARRRTVSITLNADLAAKAAAAGINRSRTAEEAIAQAFSALERERIREELREAGHITADYVSRYGRPFDDWTSEEAPQHQDDDAA